MNPDNANECIIGLLRDIRCWLRIGFYAEAKQMLADILPDEKVRRAYQMADGTRTQDAIRKTVGISPNRLGAVFTQCTQQGLMEELPDRKRLRRFDLTDFGLLTDGSDAGEDSSNS